MLNTQYHNTLVQPDPLQDSENRICSTSRVAAIVDILLAFDQWFRRIDAFWTPSIQ